MAVSVHLIADGHFGKAVLEDVFLQNALQKLGGTPPRQVEAPNTLVFCQHFV